MWPNRPLLLASRFRIAQHVGRQTKIVLNASHLQEILTRQSHCKQNLNELIAGTSGDLNSCANIVINQQKKKRRQFPISAPSKRVAFLMCNHGEIPQMTTGRPPVGKRDRNNVGSKNGALCVCVFFPWQANASCTKRIQVPTPHFASSSANYPAPAGAGAAAPRAPTTTAAAAATGPAATKATACNSSSASTRDCRGSAAPCSSSNTASPGKQRRT